MPKSGEVLRVLMGKVCTGRGRRVHLLRAGAGESLKSGDESDDV